MLFFHPISSDLLISPGRFIEHHSSSYLSLPMFLHSVSSIISLDIIMLAYLYCDAIHSVFFLFSANSFAFLSISFHVVLDVEKLSVQREKLVSLTKLYFSILSCSLLFPKNTLRLVEILNYAHLFRCSLICRNSVQCTEESNQRQVEYKLGEYSCFYMKFNKKYKVTHGAENSQCEYFNITLQTTALTETDYSTIFSYMTVCLLTSKPSVLLVVLCLHLFSSFVY